MKNRSSRPPGKSPNRSPAPRRPVGKQRPGPSAPTPRIRIDLYGHHAVRQAILNPVRVITAIYATEDQADMVDEWVRDAKQVGVKRPGIHMPDRAVFDAACGRDAVHQGVGITCDPLPDVGLEDILRGLDQNDLSSRTPRSGDPGPSSIKTAEGPGSSPLRGCARDDMHEVKLLVMLDQVTDPHNFGAILRSACAFGAAGVIVQRRHTPDINGLIAKTACGAADHIPVAYETNLSRAIEQCKEAGFTVVGLDERGEPLLPPLPVKRGEGRGEGQHKEITPSARIKAGTSPLQGEDKILLILGAEGPGLRRLVKEGCDRLVSLPTVPPIGSLNVSNAAAVALYALTSSPVRNNII